MTNEKVMILQNRLKRSTATWWLFGSQWKVVGAMKPLSRLVVNDPAQSASKIRSAGYEFIWQDRFNPAAAVDPAPAVKPRKSKKQRRAERWRPGMYEGLSADAVQQQVGSAVPKPPKGFSSTGLTMFMRPSHGWGKGGMK